MSKISRNEPCPCGSGKKYKKCCLNRDEEITRNNQSIYPANNFEEYDELDNLSNSVIDLINDGKLDDAENICKELLKRYPNQVDGLERSAMVYEARGNNEKAVSYYKQTADFARSKEGFDPEFVNWVLDKAKKLSS